MALPDSLLLTDRTGFSRAVLILLGNLVRLYPISGRTQSAVTPDIWFCWCVRV